MDNANAGQTPADAPTAAPHQGADNTTTTTVRHDGAEGGAGNIDAWSDDQLLAFLDNPGDESAEVQAPAPEVTEPEVDDEPEAQAPEEEEAPEEPTQDDDEEPTGAKKRQRLTFANDIDALAGQLYRQAQTKGSPISLGEAERRAKAALGIADEQPTHDAEAQAPEPVVSSDALAEQIAQLDKDLEAAIDDYDTNKAKELRAEIRKLEAERLEARDREAAAQGEQQSKFAEVWRAAEDKIISAYPDMGVETSVMSKRSVEVMKMWRDLGDPRADDPNAPVLIGNIVAAELGLAPGQRLGGPKPAQAKTPPAPTRRGPQPASGATGTTNPATSMSMLVDSVPDDQFEDFLHALTRG